MIKLVFCLRRKDGMSREEFQTYWSEQHAPLVAQHQEALGIRRYVQSHTRTTVLDHVLSASRRGEAEQAAIPYDGVAELWYDSADALAANAAQPGAQAAGRALLEDEAKFIDLANSPIFLSEETRII